MATTRFVITQQPNASAPKMSVEFCEHKGIGHPDSLCDGVAEAVSRTLCRAYLKWYGTIQHYNVDKALLIGGQSAPKFDGGKILTPLRLIVSGRATPIPGIELAALVVESAKEYLASALHCSTDTFVIESAVRAGSSNLTQVVGGAVAKPRSNDTSFGCGFAPPSRLEQVVLHVADTLRSPAFRRHFPAAGDDYKVMSARVGDVSTLPSLSPSWIAGCAG